MALQRQVGERDLALGADLGEHLGHVGVDVLVAERARHRDAVVAVLHEVQLADPVDVDRRHGLAAALRGGDPLPARAHLAGGGAEAAVELAAAVHGAHDRVERDHLLAEAALAAAAERGHHLLEREDHVHVARLAAERAVRRASARPRRARRSRTGRRSRGGQCPWASAPSVTSGGWCVRCERVVAFSDSTELRCEEQAVYAALAEQTARSAISSVGAMAVFVGQRALRVMPRCSRFAWCRSGRGGEAPCCRPLRGGALVCDQAACLWRWV